MAITLFLLPDGEKQMISAFSLCDPPPEPKKCNRQERRQRLDKSKSIKQRSSFAEDDELTVRSSFVDVTWMKYLTCLCYEQMMGLSFK